MLTVNHSTRTAVVSLKPIHKTRPLTKPSLTFQGSKTPSQQPPTLWQQFIAYIKGFFSWLFGTSSTPTQSNHKTQNQKKPSENTVPPSATQSVSSSSLSSEIFEQTKKSSTPRVMSKVEEDLVNYLIFDLAHPVPELAEKAKARLLELGISEELINKTTQKLKEGKIKRASNN